MEIVTGTWWTYIGPGEGKGIKHLVIKSNQREVATWSGLGEIGAGGFTYLGPPEDFRKHFKRVQ